MINETYVCYYDWVLGLTEMSTETTDGDTFIWCLYAEIDMIQHRHRSNLDIRTVKYTNTKVGVIWLHKQNPTLQDFRELITADLLPVVRDLCIGYLTKSEK